MALKISCIVIARNEAQNIAPCLATLGWADEIVVVDSGSSDETVAVARRYTDRVYDIPWRGFGPQKQAAVELASFDLIFAIDCDERVTPELAEEIRAIAFLETPLAGYSVPRRTFLGDREVHHCGWYPDRTVRLFDRRRARFSEDLVHERVIVDGTRGECTGHLLHYSFPNLTDLLAKLNRYTDLGAAQLAARGVQPSLSQVTLRPIYTFFRTYLVQCGFLDGYAGFVVSVANAVSVFFKYAKLRDLRRASMSSSSTESMR